MSLIEKTEVGSSIRDNMMLMSLEAITNRALPFLEDGFKPSQRKMLYTMKNMGLFNSKAKSANIDGQNMKINAHGSNYGTMVRMTREKEVLLTPFVAGKGSFGKVYSSSMQEAAARYTEAGLMPICHEMMDSLNKHPNNMKDNYDGTMKEPIYLSLPFPNILANPQDGIGIGFACNFPSFNLAELSDACISVLRNEKSYETISKIMPGPDFTTGGMLMIEPEEIEKIYTTGSGRVMLRAKFNDDEENRALEVIEIPYTTTAEKIIDSVQKNYDKGKFPEILDIIDEIGIDGFKVSIMYKKGTDVDELINKLYALTPLQEYFSCNMTLVYKNRPIQMGVLEIIEKWIEHRKQWVNEEIIFDINAKSEKLHLLNGLAKILLDIDKAVSIVKNSKNDEEVIEGLKSSFDIDEIQANYVAEIKLRNFNQDYILNRTKEITQLEKEIENLKNTDITEKLIEDLERIKQKYGIDRKTEIVTNWTPAVAPVVDTKALKKAKTKGNSIVFVGLNTFKRLPETSSAKCPDGYRKFKLANDDEILAFTTLGKVFKIKVHEIKSGSQAGVENALRKNDLEIGESVVFMTPLEEKKDLFIVYDNNRVLRFSQSLYSTTGNKHVFKKGYNVKANAIHFEVLDKDTTIQIAGMPDIDTSKYSAKKSRLASAEKLKK